MAKFGNLSRFTAEELKIIRETVDKATSRDYLLQTINSVIEPKEKAETEGINACIPVSYFNIDPDYRMLLYANGIENLAQLRSIKEEALWSLNGMTHGGFEQISWAREFFNMEPVVRDEDKPKIKEKQSSSKKGNK